LSDEEQQAMGELRRELAQLRSPAQRVGALQADLGREEEPDKVIQSLVTGPWRFEDRHDITIVASRWPTSALERIPYTDIDSPNHVELLTCADLDALFELHGHLRATNPISDVSMRIGSSKMMPHDYASHLVSLGGIEWNAIASSALNELGLPVRRVANRDTEGRQYLEVAEDGTVNQYRPVLEKKGDLQIVKEDIALFARAINPFNRKRSITICNGMYSRGTYGAVRALTDIRFRDRNAQYLRERFGGSDNYCILMRVPIVNGATLTPDWTDGDNFTLFEWQR
jgi:hypothetical protein